MSKYENDLMKDVYIFDHESNKWEKQTTEGEPPSNRFACAHANDLSRVYIFGGRGTDGKDRYNELYCLDLKIMKWTMCNNKSDEVNTPGCKSGAGMVVWKGKLVLFGGYGYPQNNLQNENTFCHDPECKDGKMGWTNDLHVYDPKKSEYWL